MLCACGEVWLTRMAICLLCEMGERQIASKNAFCVDSPTLIGKLWAFSNRINIKAAICNRRFTLHMSLFQCLAQRAVNQVAYPLL